VALPRLRVDGGATRSELLLQMQADVLARPVERPANVETTALGAAALAGAALLDWGLVPARADRPGHAQTAAAAGARTFKPTKAGARWRDGALRAWDVAVVATRTYRPV
jgi:glycerol kinase